MTLSALPLSYCTNVHPGRSLAEVELGLEQFTIPVQARCGTPLAAGLWLAQPVIGELLATPDRLPRFARFLRDRQLACYTLNAFPFGDFHSTRVKEQVYLPDWSERARLDYTRDCSRVLAALLPEGTEGSLSTVPLGFKGFAHPLDFAERCAGQIQELALFLDQLQRESGRMIRLAIEPEPFCVLETTAEAVAFFRRLWELCPDSRTLDAVRQHVGLCYDVCHQAVEFENIAGSISALNSAGVRIHKLHITCALELSKPADNADGLAALARYVEQRYLHQTIARISVGLRVRSVDLSAELALDPPREFREAEAWRVHFHVPVDAEHLGPLSTTRTQLKEALAAVAALDYAPHLEVETYTWEVLPGKATGRSPDELCTGLARELTATRQLLSALSTSSP